MAGRQAVLELGDRGVRLGQFPQDLERRLVGLERHGRFAGVASRNLDNWLMGDDGIIDEVLAAGRDRVSIVE